MSVGIIRLYDKINISLVIKDQLIASEVLDYTKDVMDKIFSFFHPHGIDKLNVIVPPQLYSSPHEDVFLMEQLTVNKELKLIGVVKKDIYSINTLARTLNIPTFELYSGLDFHKTLVAERSLVIDEYINNQLSISVIENSKVLDFVYCKPQTLTIVLEELQSRFNATKIINATNATSVTLDLGRDLLNYRNLSTDERTYLSSVLFSLVCPPSRLMEVDEFSEIINASEPEIKAETLTEIVKKENFVQEIMDMDNETAAKEVGVFWRFLRLFKRKQDPDLEFVPPPSRYPVLSKVATSLLVLAAIVAGGNIAAQIKFAEGTKTIKSHSATGDVGNIQYYQAADSNLDSILSTLRNGGGPASNVVDIVSSWKFNGKLGSIHSRKVGFSISVYVPTVKDADAFVNLASQHFNVQKTDLVKDVVLGSAMYIKLTLDCI